MPLNLILPLVAGLIVIFVIIALILRLMLRGHVDVALKRVQQLNEDNLRRELGLKRKLDEAEKEYQRKIAEASKNTARLEEEGQRLIQNMKEKALTETNRERTEILVEAKDEAERIKNRILREQEERILDRASELLKFVLTDQLTQDMHAHFTSQVMAELAHEKRKLETATDTAEIISAQPLTDDQKKRLVQLLSEKTGKKIKLKETTDTDHTIAGVYVKLENLIIDGTLRYRLHQVLIQAKESLTK